MVECSRGNTVTRYLFGALGAAALLAAGPAASLDDVDSEDSYYFVLDAPWTAESLSEADSRAMTLGQGLNLALRDAVQGNLGRALLGVAESGIEFWMPGFGENLPEWAQHIEFEVEFQEDNEPEWSLLVVLPLYESENDQDTFFTQLSQRRYTLFGDSRDVTNAGLGYRRLLFDNTVLVGVNGFFDFEWDNKHQRTSAGAEAKWTGFDLSSNYYFGLTNAKSAGANVTEKALDGWDVELTAQVPYLPWARARGKRFEWQTENLENDIDGWSASLEMDISQNLQIEGGFIDDNFTDTEGFLQITFRMAFGRPVALSSMLFDDQPWQIRDMREYRLDKVRRENRIIVERQSSGVVITRGS